MDEADSRPSVLLVDDDEALLRLHERALEKHGYRVAAAENGHIAVNLLEQSAFDVILSDIDMPEMDGLRLLEQVRQHDLDVPVVLITGRPSLDTAIKAIDRGALRYLVKPVALEELTHVLDDAVRLHQLAKAKRIALTLSGGPDRFIGDQAGLSASFERALDRLSLAYQPIVSWSRRRVFAFEALLRSDEPALPSPAAVIDAAERLGRLHDLGRLLRASAVAPIDRMDQDVLLFVNLHPIDLLDDELLLPATAFSRAAKRVVVEITERASLDRIPNVRQRIAALRAIGFRIALDDLGAGFGGLTSFSFLEPDFVKLDIGLVRNLPHEPTKQTVVGTMIRMCAELGVAIMAEGIETPGERDALAHAGCDLMQGYLFARPGPPFPVPVF